MPQIIVSRDELQQRVKPSRQRLANAVLSAQPSRETQEGSFC